MKILIHSDHVLRQRVIQLTALEDWSVADKQQWDSAEQFLEDTLDGLLNKGMEHRAVEELMLIN